jgi:cytochrome b561
MTTASASTRMDQERYSAIAMGLHWLIAALIAVQLGLGWWMNEVLPDHTPIQSTVEGVHISLGLTTLILILARIGVRLTHRPPPLPAGMPSWERFLSHAVHILLYAMMLILPLSGWAMESTGAKPIPFWGLTWPHLPGVDLVLGSPVPRATRHALKHLHVYTLIWIFLASLALHVAGAIKHQFDGRPVLWRMTPLKPPAA